MSKLELQDVTPELLGLKPWYKSRTLWLNIATVAASGGVVVGNFSGLISPLAYAIAMSVVAVANIALRLMTDEGVA